MSYVRERDVTPSTLDFLLKATFRIKPNDMYSDKDEEGIDTPILSFLDHSEFLGLNINFNRMEEVSSKKNHALCELKTIIHNNTIELTLNTGDAIYINNRLAIHSRPIYKPFYGDTARWLCRIICQMND